MQIKPDNWLIDSNGHLAISDFGLATDLQFSHDGAYYEQHRRELLYKHGIDLEDASGCVPEGRRSFDPPRSERDDEKTASVLTWRDMSRRKQAFSVVGTTNYMSPEVLRGRGYGVASDWWSCVWLTPIHSARLTVAFWAQRRRHHVRMPVRLPAFRYKVAPRDAEQGAP